jgi:hypothetical protein
MHVVPAAEVHAAEAVASVGDVESVQVVSMVQVAPDGNADAFIASVIAPPQFARDIAGTNVAELVPTQPLPAPSAGSNVEGAASGSTGIADDGGGASGGSAGGTDDGTGEDHDLAAVNGQPQEPPHANIGVEVYLFLAAMLAGLFMLLGGAVRTLGMCIGVMVCVVSTLWLVPPTHVWIIASMQQGGVLHPIVNAWDISPMLPFLIFINRLYTRFVYPVVQRLPKVQEIWDSCASTTRTWALACGTALQKARSIITKAIMALWSACLGAVTYVWSGIRQCCGWVWRQFPTWTRICECARKAWTACVAVAKWLYQHKDKLLIPFQLIYKVLSACMSFVTTCLNVCRRGIQAMIPICSRLGNYLATWVWDDILIRTVVIGCVLKNLASISQYCEFKREMCGARFAPVVIKGVVQYLTILEAVSSLPEYLGTISVVFTVYLVLASCCKSRYLRLCMGAVLTAIVLQAPPYVVVGECSTQYLQTLCLKRPLKSLEQPLAKV